MKWHERFFKAVLYLVCSAAGAVSAIGLAGGAGPCSLAMTWGVFWFAATLSVIVPFLIEVGLPRKEIKLQWYLPPVLLGAPLCYPAIAGLLEQEWSRLAAALICLLLAFLAAFLALAIITRRTKGVAS